MKIERELMRGAGPIAVLKLLENGEMYGYELIVALAKRTDDTLKMGQSTLYPLLYNLEAKGLIESSVRETPSGRERRYYKLTPEGRTHLAEKTRQWRSVARAMEALGIVTDVSAAGA